MEQPVAVKQASNGDAQVYYLGKPLYAPAPRDAARRRVERLALQPDTLILWSAPLLWYGAQQLLDLLPPGCRVFAVECNRDLYEFTRQRAQLRDERISLFDGSASSLHLMLSHVDESRLRRVVELTTNSAAMLSRPEYRRIVATLERQIRITWQNRRTLQAMSRLWIRNIQRNIPLLPRASVVRGSAQRDVAVCGAGPSLERAIPFLRHTRAVITIVAVDTALPILEAHDITPDIVVALEGQLYNAYDFLPVSDRGYALISDLTGSFVVAEMHSRITWTLSEFGESSLVRRVSDLPGISTVLPPLGSVGVAAVDLAQRLVSGRVFLSGLDFAVQPGKTHARGAPGYLFALARTQKTSPVRDRGIEVNLHTHAGAEGTVGTTQVLLGYARDLERIADRKRCLVLEPDGVALSLHSLGTNEAYELLGSGIDPPRVEPPNEALVWNRAILIKRFVQNEIEVLENLLTGKKPEAERAAALADYLVADTGFERPGANALIANPAVRINAEYFLSRWKLTERLLEQRY
ncbi:MAG: 6-hydroxymethylpterin diphosphokinase MptE-like protein [Spirochaetales bacterium]